MKTEQQIKEEIQRHKEAIKENWNNEKDRKISQCIISTLEWVLR